MGAAIAIPGASLNITIDYPAAGSCSRPNFLRPGSCGAILRAPPHSGVSKPFLPMVRHRSAPLHAELSVQQRGTRTWRPDAETWTAIKRPSVAAPGNHPD
jgi:hypothetical protein